MATGLRSSIHVLLAAASVLAGCGDDDSNEGTSTAQQTARHGLSAEEAAKPLAKVGDKTLTLGDFADEIANQSPYLRGRFQSYEKRREYLDKMVEFELLAQEAERRGLMKHPRVQKERKKLLEQQLIAEEVDDKLAADPIGEDDIREHYEAHIDEFKKPAQRRISHIVVKREAQAKKLLEQLGEKPDDTTFRKAAATTSTNEDTGSRFGDTGFHTHPDDRAEGEASTLPDAVVEAAFELEELGQIHSKPIKAKDGFHIVRLTAKRDAFTRTLEQASRPIRAQLEKERRDKALGELTQRLRKAANVVIQEDALKKLIAEYSRNSAATPTEEATP